MVGRGSSRLKDVCHCPFMQCSCCHSFTARANNVCCANTPAMCKVWTVNSLLPSSESSNWNFWLFIRNCSLSHSLLQKYLLVCACTDTIRMIKLRWMRWIYNTHGWDKKHVQNYSLKTWWDRHRHRCEDSIKMDLK